MAGEREIESPVIRLQGSEGELELHYLNTRLRTFLDPQYDHIEYRGDDGLLKGIRASRAILDLLFENQYPMSFDPIVDDHTFDWYVRSETRGLDEELDNL